jgi:hypothetical protein
LDEENNMAKFRVFANMTTLYAVEVEAETADQAYDIAKQLDGGDFDECGETGYNGSWTVLYDDIYEIEGDDDDY